MLLQFLKLGYFCSFPLWISLILFFKLCLTAGEPEAVIDLQAEMRAARLKMQQQYEDALKKKQVSFWV